ncbi:hypothetical protein AHMF7605_10455 [Adhaeribacter arboris]|uniref:Uncharacterized protein n=1 Tax=Adhaeribacter arboris TaxID=2072846 RepID=A0A2T2YEM5_9BACT|nr:hypothetical protein [Adhaeribacter arboris]PSR53908.1 hypothetical protein AHMF7605_10455 [Adhaeribacter arboris]
MEQHLPEAIKPKAKLDTRLDRLYYSFLDEEVEKSLSAKDREYLEQLEAAWSLLVQYHSFEQSVPLLKSRFQISRSTAYRVLNDCTRLFGDVTQTSKQGYRHILYEYSMRVFQLAATQNPPELGQMNRAIKNMAMLKGLDQNDAGSFDAELLEAHTYLLQLTAKGSEKPKTLNINAINKLPETEYQEVMESVEEEGLGNQSIDDILDGKLSSDQEEEDD